MGDGYNEGYEIVLSLRTGLVKQGDLESEIWFVCSSDPYAPEVRLTPQQWRDLGSPSLVTITVEAGIE